MRLRTAIALTLVIASPVALVGSPASAGGKAMSQVRGTADFKDSGCAGLNLEPSSAGWSLDGCLVITSVTREQWNPSVTYQENGTELFVGNLFIDGVDQGPGTFETTYQFRAKFEERGNFDTEIFGRCQHPIVSGTGVFKYVEGRLDFKDVLEGPGAPYFPYRGHMRV